MLKNNFYVYLICFQCEKKGEIKISGFLSNESIDYFVYEKKYGE